MQWETEKWITIARSGTCWNYIKKETGEVKTTTAIGYVYFNLIGSNVTVRQISDNWICLKIKEEARRQTKYLVVEQIPIRVCKQPIEGDRDKILRLE